MTAPYVLKADGLAAGKGVLIINDLDEAKSSLKEMLEGKFGASSSKVVVEAFFRRIGVFCFCAYLMEMITSFFQKQRLQKNRRK